MTPPPFDPADPPWLVPWLRGWREHPDQRLAWAATVSPAGRPEVRTVVLREVDAGGAPLFTTDARSAKAEALRAGSALELCVWWRDGVQYRLRGAPETIGADGDAALRGRLWRAMDDAARAGMLGPAPGTPLADGAATPDDGGAVGPTEEPTGGGAPPATLLVVRLAPRRVERLVLPPRGGGGTVRRAIWARTEGGWRGGPVVP